MMATTLLHNPSCSKSRGAHGLLAEYTAKHGLAVDVIEYLQVAWTRADLESLLRKLAPTEPTPPPTLMMRTGDAAFRDQGLDKLDPIADRLLLLDAMVATPSLIERPIFVHGARAVIGRPPERVLELLP